VVEFEPLIGVFVSVVALFNFIFSSCKEFHVLNAQIVANPARSAWNSTLQRHGKLAKLG
jgi:hypothetical protein